MARWFAKRWVWAALAGGAVTVGAAAGRADGDGPPKVGTVVSLNIDGKGDRQFKVIKTDKQPDGTYLSELKDTKTGETITLVDKPDDGAPKAGEPAKAPEAPAKAKPRTTDPLTPPMSAALPDAPKDKEKEKEKRTVVGRIFGDKDKSAVPEQMPAAAAPAPEKKPGLLGRVFGPKKPAGPAMPAAGAAAAPAAKPSPSAPPAVIPTPPGGVSGVPAFPNTAGSTAEPPRVMPKPAPTPAVPAPMPAFPAPAPAKPAPVAPPVPSIPVPMPMPSNAPAPAPAFPTPSVPVPVPLPAPAFPAPALPPIPVPPGGTSSVGPVQSVVVPAGFLPAGVAFDREVQPLVIALQSMDAPSARLTAAKGLAQCRHASTDGVKGALFQAAQLDPCPEVRAECIGHLCALGYFSPHFLGFIQTACEDSSPVVRDAAKAACAKMIRQK